jgi:RecA-family ATPase
MGPTGFDLLRALSGLPEGERDDQIFRAACSFRGSNTRRDVALQAVAEAAVRCVPPFSVQRAMEKVYRAYSRYPAGNGETSLLAKKSGMTLASEYLQEHAKRASRHAWWNGILYAGAFNMLLGRPFTGKSSFAAALTRALVLGEPFLGRHCPKARVGYFALERNGATVAKLFDQWGIADHVYFADEIPAQDAARFIEGEIKRLALDFVIIDHLQHAARIQKGNEYTEVSNALFPYQEIAKHTGCCILALHHQGKGEREDGDESVIEALGSEAYRAASDTLIEATKVKGEFFVRAHTRSGMDLARTHILIDFEKGEIEATDTHEADIKAAANAIKQFLSSTTAPMNEKEIRKGVGGRGITVSEALRVGNDRGIFGRGGKGGKADPYRYFCVSRDPIPINSQDTNPEKEQETIADPDDLRVPSFGTRIPTAASTGLMSQRVPNAGTRKSLDSADTFPPESDSFSINGGAGSLDKQDTPDAQDLNRAYRIQRCPYDDARCPLTAECEVENPNIGCVRLRTQSSAARAAEDIDPNEGEIPGLDDEDGE